MSFKNLIEVVKNEKQKIKVEKEEMTKNLSNLLSFKVDSFLASRKEKQRRGGFHPSEISRGFCPRELVELRLGKTVKKEVFRPQTHRVFDNGHYFHSRMQNYVKDMGIVLNHPAFNSTRNVSEEVFLEHPVGLTGNTDNILDMENYWFIVDYKSSRSSVFNKLSEPLDASKKQVWLYLGMFAHMGNEGVEYKVTVDKESITKYEFFTDKKLKGLILYENKDTQEFKEFLIEWNEEAKEYFNSVVSTLERVNLAVDSKNPLMVECVCGKCNSL